MLITFQCISFVRKKYSVFRDKTWICVLVLASSSNMYFRAIFFTSCLYVVVCSPVLKNVDDDLTVEVPLNDQDLTTTSSDSTEKVKNEPIEESIGNFTTEKSIEFSNSNSNWKRNATRVLQPTCFRLVACFRKILCEDLIFFFSSLSGSSDAICSRV